MRIGELLLGQRKVRQSDLTRCLEEQPAQKRRLVSLLIRAGALEFDDGSRALGEQHGMACVLAKHLASRDPALASVIPAELARAWCALPIGRTKGALVVCVRDPGPQLKVQIEQAIREDVMLVLSPSLRLEGLVAEVYGPAPDDEFDVSLDSAVDIEPPLPDMAALDPASVRLSLTDLDDARVTKDPSQSGSKLPVATKAVATTPAPAAVPTPTPPSKKRASAPPPPTLAATAEALDLASTRDDATEAVMRFLDGNWVSAIVLAIREEAAIGYRGHGATIGAVDGYVIPLLSESTVQRAVDTRRTAIESGESTTQHELVRRLGTGAPAAAPVMVDGEVVAVIAVGDPVRQRLVDTDRSLGELGRVARLLGSAWERIRGTR